MTWGRRALAVLLVVAVGSGLPPAAAEEPDVADGDIVVDVTNRNVAPGWVVRVADLTCPAETEVLVSREVYSDGSEFTEQLTADDFDMSPWQTGDSVPATFEPGPNSPPGLLQWFLSCADAAVSVIFGSARLDLQILTQFSDVELGSFYDDAVMWARLLEVTTGTSSTSFSPDDAVVRWQMALFLQRVAALGGDTPGGVDTFSDTGHLRTEFRTAIGWLADTGITTGVGGNRFDPDGSVSRWQMALFLFRLAHYFGVSPTSQVDTFSDTGALSPDFRGAIGWLAETEITTGVGDNRFDPDGTVSRAQMVTFLYRFVLWLGTQAP